jgi:hypothetical protein
MPRVGDCGRKVKLSDLRAAAEAEDWVTYQKNVRDKALLPLWEEPNIMRAISFDLRAVGIEGEVLNARLAYTGFTSRVLDEPFHVITRGTTGMGKTTLLKKAGKLIPDDYKLELVGLTNASLFNYVKANGAKSLEHMLLISGERKRSKDPAVTDAKANLRQLLSEKEIKRITSVQRAGKSVTDWIGEVQNVTGPVAYGESTTAGSIFSEDLNRLLQLYVDESEELTRKIGRRKIEKYKKGYVEMDIQPVIDRHHEFQKRLQNTTVVLPIIPYAETLMDKLPLKGEANRRLIDQVFSVLEAIVLLRQFQSDRKWEDGQPVADRWDYFYLHQMMMDPLFAAMGLATSYQLYNRLWKALGSKAEFDSNEVTDTKLFGNKVSRDRALASLVELRLIDRASEGYSHNPAKWKWTSGAKKPQEELVLPSVETVCGGKAS